MKCLLSVFGMLLYSVSGWAGRSAGTTGIQARLYNWQSTQNSCYLTAGARYTIESQSPTVPQDVTVSVKN